LGHEPEIAIGILTGARHVTVRAKGTATATWWSEAGAHRRALVGPVELHAALEEGNPAPMGYLVALTDLRPMSQPSPQLPSPPCPPQEVAAQKQALGHLWPLAHGAQDLRQARWVAHAAGLQEATVLAQNLKGLCRELQDPEPHRLGYPTGTLALHTVGPVGSEVLGQASGILTLEAEADGVLEVAQVPYGMGYPWAGSQNRAYRGKISIVLDAEGTLAVVNTVAIETLLGGIVGAEMPPHAPAEALKAQAIAARTNVLFELGQRHLEAPFHFCAEQHCQVYAGVGAEDGRTRAAVEETRGTVLLHDGAVVHALFSADCGGRTENNDVAWPKRPDLSLRSISDGCWADDAPPKAHALGDLWDSEQALQAFVQAPSATFCGTGAPGRSMGRPWRRTVTPRQLAALWAPHQRALGPLRQVLMGPRGPGGRLLSVTFVGTLGSHTVQRELAIRQALGGLPSAAAILTPTFDADQHVSALKVVGTGWGHGVGLCQRGAMGRAAHGWDAPAILAHYYGGAQGLPLW
jgi:SpoIID/LytB domain protein